MNEMFSEFEFNEAAKYAIKEINGVQLPKDYLNFMSEHNGGEGAVGENLYMRLYKLEELIDYNNDYEISKYLPDFFIFGTDGGGMLFGYDSKKELYYAVDSCSMDEDDMFYEADSLESFINTMDRELA